MPQTMLNYVLILICVCYFSTSQAQYEDVRCKCVCPSGPAMMPNETSAKTKNRKIFIEVFKEPADCKCENMVEQQGLHPASVEDFCARCECKWQRRNTTTIKVVVIIIICVISLLFLYMLFLLCLDPLMSRRPKTYLEQRNEEVNLDTQSIHEVTMDDEQPSGSQRRQREGALISRVKHEVNRVKGEQKKWKGTVQEQRKNIFDRHTMLN